MLGDALVWWRASNWGEHEEMLESFKKLFSNKIANLKTRFWKKIEIKRFPK